jgi:hypothetical protein
LDNLTLLCGHHHRSFDQAGWTCRMTDGVPHWLPPPWQHPDQTPRVNTAHHHHLLHPAELLTATGAGPP